MNESTGMITLLTQSDPTEADMISFQLKAQNVNENHNLKKYGVMGLFLISKREMGRIASLGMPSPHELTLSFACDIR